MKNVNGTMKTAKSEADAKKTEPLLSPRLQLILMYAAFFLLLGIADRFLNFLFLS